MSKNENGFGIIAVILIVVTLGIIGFMGWRVYEANKKVSQNPEDDLTIQKSQDSLIPKGWKKYENKDLGFSFIYPETWTSVEQKEDKPSLGVVVKLVSPEQKVKYDEFIAAGYSIDGPPDATVAVSHWESINDPAAKGASSLGEPTYDNLEDYFNSTYQMKIKQKIGQKIVNGQKAYEVSIGGFGQTYGIMFERTDGIYQVEFFGEFWQKTSLTEEENKLVESFKFNQD